jgi:hypothetical protein
MRLTGPQIAAAISLARMTRLAVSKEAHVGPNTLDKIINETTNCRDGTLQKIRAVLERRGIEFLPADGIRRKEQSVTMYTGKTCLQDLLLDVYKTLGGEGGELLIAHLDEGQALKSLKADFLNDQIQKRKEANITCRALVRENDPNLIPPYDSYRAIPDASFSPYPFYIYGPKLALLSWKPSARVIIVDDQRWADSASKLFDLAWNTGRKITGGRK